MFAVKTLLYREQNTFVLFYVCSFITGSYDRTCKIWDTASEEELHTLEGHRNVVYAIAYNNPFGFAFLLAML